MDAMEAIFARRSIRTYTNQEISQQDLGEILAAALMAPSATNTQPWYFVVIQSRAQMERLTEIMGWVSQQVAPRLEERFAQHPAVVEETTRFIRRMGGAPVCVLAFLEKPAHSGNPGMLQSVAAAMENLLIAAASKGIGSCWLTAPCEVGASGRLQEAFAPGKGDLVAMATLGYPAQTPKTPDRKAGRFTVL